MSNKNRRPNRVMLPTNRPVPHPGEILYQQFLVPLEISQTDLAAHLQVGNNHINEIRTGRRGISAKMAIRLAAAFNTSELFWLNLQNYYDLAKAVPSDFAHIKPMIATE